MKEQAVVRKVLFIAICASISASLQVFQDAFIYWRPILLEQPWRFWTSHWVHVGWMHYLFNALAFACLPFIFPQAKNRYLLSLLLILPPCISFTFYYLYPQIEAYAGLSGVLHGLYVATAVYLLQFKHERKFSVLVIGLVISKILWENFFGSLHTDELIGSPVLLEAHFVGGIWGAVLAMIWLGLDKSIQQIQRR